MSEGGVTGFVRRLLGSRAKPTDQDEVAETGSAANEAANLEPTFYGIMSDIPANPPSADAPPSDGPSQIDATGVGVLGPAPAEPSGGASGPGVYKSTDGGGSWQADGTGTNNANFGTPVEGARPTADAGGVSHEDDWSSGNWPAAEPLDAMDYPGAYAQPFSGINDDAGSDTAASRDPGREDPDALGGGPGSTEYPNVTFYVPEAESEPGASQEGAAHEWHDDFIAVGKNSQDAPVQPNESDLDLLARPATSPDPAAMDGGILVVSATEDPEPVVDGVAAGDGLGDGEDEEEESASLVDLRGDSGFVSADEGRGDVALDLDDEGAEGLGDALDP